MFFFSFSEDRRNARPPRKKIIVKKTIQTMTGYPYISGVEKKERKSRFGSGKKRNDGV